MKPFESKLTSEFADQDWEDYRDAWVEQYTQDLVRIGADERHAHAEATLQWDRHAPKNDWASRDGRIESLRQSTHNC